MKEIEKVDDSESRDLFSRWFGDVTWPQLGAWMRPEVWAHVGPPVRLEEYREGDDYVVRAEMPGIDPDKDLELTVRDHTLRIQAERKEEVKADDKDRFRSEFRYGSFARLVSLPADAASDDVKATYKDGVLEVRIHANAATAEAAKIPVMRS